LNFQQGNQPNDGTMTHTIVRGRIPGYPERDHIRITYTFPNGVQGTEHPRPGNSYRGTRRVCFLPNNAEGREVLSLLDYAFGRRLVFTVGDSVTSGQQNVVTWNGVHHKTNKNGGRVVFEFFRLKSTQGFLILNFDASESFKKQKCST
jgi:deltex-like protein